MSKPLTDYKALTFDCYGTLIDWESGIWDAAQPLLMANNSDAVSRERFLRAFAVVETAQEVATPGMLYPDLLSKVHGTLAGQFGFATAEPLDGAFGASLPHWPAFPDSADALRVLKKHYKLVILSNVNRDGFAASSRKLGVAFDAIYTAQDIGSYKPNPRNFTYLMERLQAEHGIAPSDILHTAQSMHHDHVQATAHGLATAWIDRQRLSQGGNWGATAEVAQRPKTDFVYFSMAEMADAVRSAG
ncbi:Haloacid dehalogenase, type II:HAD-superfamily hydrolase, subfamily IA, variant 2 [alpha proteobacterium BAL199]|nr:Haloacid dehalogenase, type II:HAD-superfamily hydrolase, subfamily IA, variant 2 [alpha proteobacterium BAL199]